MVAVQWIGLYSQNVYQNQNLFLSFEGFYQPAFSFSDGFTLRQAKTNARNATSLCTLCFKDYHYAFREWHSLKFLFLYLWYIPPYSYAFHTFFFTPFFSSCILPCRILFFYPRWCCWLAKGNRFFSLLLPLLFIFWFW